MPHVHDIPGAAAGPAAVVVGHYELEVRGQHAADLHGNAVDVNSPAEYLMIRAVSPRPKTVGDDYRASSVLAHRGQLVVLRKTAAQYWLATEELEEVACYVRDFDWLGRAVAGECIVYRVVDRNEGLEARATLSIVGEIGARNLNFVCGCGHVAIPDHHEPVGVAVGQRRKQNPVDHREHCDVSSYAKRQSPDDRGAEPGMLS